MKLKRVLLIVLAGIFVCAMGVCIYGLDTFLKENSSMLNYWVISYCVSIISYVNNLAYYLRAICLLAIVDFLFCVGQKRYNKSMLGISVASFALGIIVYLVNFWCSSYFSDIIIKTDDFAVMRYYYLWTALSTLPFVGLTLAYIVVKAKFLKSQSNQ